MKNILKNVLSTLSIIAIILTTTLIGVACSNTKASQNKVNVNNTNLTEDTGSTTIPVADEEQNKEPEINLNGIYKYARPITFQDIWYEDETAVYNFFETRDLNGVYDAVKRLGFDEYFNFLIKEEGSEATTESMLYFNNGKVSSVLHYEDGLYKIEKSSQSVNDFCLKIEFDEVNNIYVVYRQFCYFDETTGKTVQTPLYVKAPISYIQNSADINNGIDYVYKSNSAVVNVANDNVLETKEYINKLANIFGLEENEDTTITMNEVVAILSKYTYKFTSEFEKLTMFDAEEKFTFTILTDNVYSIIGLNFNFDGNEHNLSTNEKLVNLSVTIEGNTNLTFSLIQK